MSSQLQFVSADGLGQPRESDRRLIRSHCMRGRNAKEGSRRAIRQAKKRQRADAAAVKDESDARLPRVSLTIHVDLADLKLLKRPSMYPCEVVDGGSEFQAAGQLVYSVESCVDFSSFRCGFFSWMFYDPAFMQSILLASSAMSDLRMQNQPTRATFKHLRRTLTQLSKQLAKQDAIMIDSILFVVVVLASVAVMFGDASAAESHVMGLDRMLQLRGGYSYVRSSLKLQFKVDRLGLAWYLMTGRRNNLLPAPESWDATYPNALPAPKRSVKPLSLQGLVHPLLATVFEDLQSLVRLINDSTDRDSMLDGNQFQEPNHSILSRLIFFESGSDVTSECGRLAMLAFLTSLYQVSGVKPHYPYLAERIRYFYPLFEASTPDLQDLWIWISIFGTLSAPETDEPWLRVKFTAVSGRKLTWNNARKRLKRAIWIDSIHDEVGKEQFSRLIGS